MLGQTVGKYRVVSRLGRGGMGTVYKAVDETLDREVAIKCLNADLGDADLLKRFRAEAITLARLNHPNIATLFELTEHEGQLLMVMEFVRGETFDKVSQREGPLPVARAGQLCIQVLDALEHAHRAGVVHRDLKPANLMLTESGLVKVMDFGLARMAGTEHLTNDGYMVGTPAYMSPEQVLGREIDGRADLYAMGVVLFRLLTSQLPFKADSGIAMVQHQLNDPPTPVRQLRSELPESCETLITRALEKSAGDRFQSAEAFKAALAELDPSLAATSLSRISVVAPADAPIPVPEAEATLPPTPTPMAASVAGLAPQTVVLPRDPSSAAPAATEQRKTEPLTPSEVRQLAAVPLPAAAAPSAAEPSAPPAAAAPSAPTASAGPSAAPAAAQPPAKPAAPLPAVPHAAPRAAAITSSAAPGARPAGRSPVIPVAVAAGVLLVAGIAAVFVWRSHRAASATPVSSAAASPPAAAAPSAQAPATGSPSASPAEPAPAAPSAAAAIPEPSAPSGSSASAPPPASASSAVPAASTSAPKSALPASAAPVTPAPPTVSTSAPHAPSPKPAAPKKSPVTPAAPPPAPAAAPPPEVKPALPSVTFGKLKLLLFDDKGTRDRDVALRLDSDALQVIDGATTLQTTSYQDVIGIYYSHSKEPRWATGDGQSAAVGKAGGAFGFFKGTPDWITVRTRKMFIPLRVREDDVHRITTELAARTGLQVVTAK